jgi:hypothetical protein
MSEEQRYAAVQEQMKGLLDTAAKDVNPIADLLRAILYAELYERNERTHQRVVAARLDLVQTLEARISEKS